MAEILHSNKASILSHVHTSFRPVFLVVLPTLILCIAMLEVGLRIKGRIPSNVTEGIFEPWGNIWRLRANMTKLSRTPSFTYTIHTNAYGFRDRVTGPRTLGPAPYHAFIGDSATFANGVDYDDSFVGVYARSAAARGVDVINLAVPGHRFLDQAMVLRDHMASAPYKPARVILVFTKDFITLYDRDVKGLVIKDGYLFFGENWRLSYLVSALGARSAAYNFFRDNIRKIQGRISPARQKVAASDFLRDFSRESPWAFQPTVARFEALLASVDELIRKAGADPVYVYLPVSRDLVADEFLAIAVKNAADYDFLRFVNLVKHHADRSGIAFFDLSPVLRRLQAASEPLAFMQDPHYVSGPNHAIGHFLAEVLLGDAEFVAVRR